MLLRPHPPARLDRHPGTYAWTYAGDTFHLIRAGLVGDPSKGVSAAVRAHPKVFATLTAPSFGPVHNRPASGRCRCGTTHAGDLWRRFTIYLRREIAHRAGLSQTALKEVCRVSFGKVAEFQKRGAIHFHAIVRLDGPGGPDNDPAPAENLIRAGHAACWYSWRRPPSRSRRRMSRWVICCGSVICLGNGCSGRALVMPW
jgi:hypothetical protein